MIPRDEPRPRYRRLRAFAAPVLLLVIGIALGRLSVPGDVETVIEPADRSGSQTWTAPSLPVEPPPAAASHTRDGAARAAARALSSLADARLLLSRDRRRMVVSEIAPPAYRAELNPLFDRTYDYLAGILGTPARRGEVVLQMTPLGYRIEAFSARRATVAIWQVTLLATPERASIAAWSTSRAELIWSGARWRVERFGIDTPGPTPSVTAPMAATTPGDFVAAARGLASFAP